MWRKTFRWAALPPISSPFHLPPHQSLHPNYKSITFITIHFPNPPIFPFPTPPKPFSSNPTSNNLQIPEIGIEDDEDDESETPADLLLIRDANTVINCLRDLGSNSADAKRRLEHSGVLPSPDLVSHVLSRFRNDWAAAFTFFLWAGKQSGYAHNIRAYHSMIAILGKMRRFDTAWTLIGEMRGGDASSGGSGSSSQISSQTLMILIRKYAAIHDVAKAIGAFYSFKKFGLQAGILDFQGLLGALCRYKNVEDAEHLLFCNEDRFPFATKSFNIVLSGWCNIHVHVREARRFWKEFEKRRVERDVVSYGCMISCFSKAGKINNVLKLFDRMKDLCISPDVKVFNSVVYALAKSRRIEKAKEIVRVMEEENGIAPNAVTFNSLIRPLCRFGRLEDAREVFDEMSKRGITPSIRTFHAFFDVLKNEKDVFELLKQMKRTSCKPAMDTYIMLIRKFCRWREHSSVVRIWEEITKSGMSPDRSSYIVLIHGLFLNGRLEEASKYFEEMKKKGFEPEPATEEMIQSWLADKTYAGKPESIDFDFESSDTLRKSGKFQRRSAQNMPRSSGT